MALKSNLKREHLEARKKAFLAEVRKWQIKFLKRLGEKCIIHAREIPPHIGYTDQTGAARSSTGYTVFENGVAIHENYEIVLGNEEGVREGKKLAREVAKKYRGIYIVFVAGMYYTVYLEIKGRDVLTSAELLAIREAPKLIEAINKAIKQV